MLMRGQALSRVGEPIEHVYFPTGGLISMMAVIGEGQRIEVAMIGREGGVGLLAGVGDPIAKSLFLVQVPGEALSVAAEEFRALVRGSDGLRRAVIRNTEQAYAQVVQGAACNALCSAEIRLARWLLMCHDRIDGDRIPLKQEELAETLGLQRTTVTGAARALQARGLIDYRRGVIRLLGRQGLMALVGSCYVEPSTPSFRAGSQEETRSPPAVPRLGTEAG
jgi:CRP-like cAMP-binding protein